MDKCPRCGYSLVPAVRKPLHQLVREEADANVAALHRDWPNVSTRDELVAAVAKDYEENFPRSWKAVTRDEAIKLALDAYGKFLP